MSSCVNARLADPAAAPPAASPLAIGSPYGFRHDVHVRFNFAEARFEGVPDDFCALLAPTTGPAAPPATASGGGGSSPFGCASALVSSFHAPGKRARAPSASLPPAAEELNRQFGVPFRQLPRVAVAGYADRIPAVLVMLRHHFLARAGFRAPHIFRESPSKADRDQAVRDVNRGAFSPEQHDVRVLADLLKVWFRELPVPVLHEIPPADLQRLARGQSCPSDGDDGDDDDGDDDDGEGEGGEGRTPAQRVARRVLRRLGSLERSVLLWLADLLALVAAHEPENHMGVGQLAIVIAPNLVRLDCSAVDDPAAAVALSKAAVDLLRAVLQARVERRARAEDKENER